MIGSRNDLVTQWIGLLDDVVVFDHALSDDDIDVVMNDDLILRTGSPNPSGIRCARAGQSGQGKGEFVQRCGVRQTDG